MNNNNKDDALLQVDAEDNLRKLFHKFVTMRKIFNMISLKKNSFVIGGTQQARKTVHVYIFSERKRDWPDSRITSNIYE